MPNKASSTRTDPRYRNARWLKVRRFVLSRDLYRCWVADCPRQGNVADHIEPVYVGMPDARFYDPANLRASCRLHNVARGFAATLERDTAGRGPVLPRRRWASVNWGNR